MDRPSRLVPLVAALCIGLLCVPLTGCRESHGSPGGNAAPGTSTSPASPPSLRAGAASVDATPPVGVPLAGYGGGDRRLSFPDFNPLVPHTFLEPSTGVHDPIRARALVLDDGTDRVAILAMDAIATDRDVTEQAHRLARARGFTVPLDRVIFCASHTHSGPGAMSDRTFWELTAADRLVDSVRDDFAASLAQALVRAESSLRPAVLGVGTVSLPGVTHNRRAGVSPHIDRDDVDDELGVVRVDTPAGHPIATVWNFAIHGTALGTSNHEYSADIMGAASTAVEQAVGGICLFLNGAVGDIAPDHGGFSGIATGGRIIGDAVASARANLATSDRVDLDGASEIVPFGTATIDAATSRIPGSFRDPLGILPFLRRHDLGVGIAIPLGPAWIENTFRFTALRIGDVVLATVPGEPIHELGLRIKNDGAGLGYRHTFVATLANGHMSYVATRREYHVGGYEGIATLFGPDTGRNVRDACERVMQAVR